MLICVTEFLRYNQFETVCCMQSTVLSVLTDRIVTRLVYDICGPH